MSLQTPLVLPICFLVDQYGRIAVIYKGGVTADQIIDDLALLNAADEDLPDLAAGFRGQWHRLPRAEYANVVAARLQDEGLTFDAIRYVESAIAVTEAGQSSRRARPVLDLWLTLARLRLQAGDTEGALIAYRQTLALDPNHIGANKECGKLLFDLGQPAEAKPMLEMATKLDNSATWRFQACGREICGAFLDQSFELSQRLEDVDDQFLGMTSSLVLRPCRRDCTQLTDSFQGLGQHGTIKSQLCYSRSESVSW